jgi:CheY-like chemotaxis protein
MKILIVDDEEDIRESLSDFFQDAGFEVEVAMHGLEAWERLEKANAPCVVVLDLAMPIMDGNALYARMRGDPRFSSIPVVIATSNPGWAPSGVTTMRKPVDLDRLMSTVKTYCDEVP